MTKKKIALITLSPVILILALVTIIPNCYRPITGKVVDAETGKPIEGAVVLVEWTQTHGFGLTYTTSAEVFEGLTNREGIINIPGLFQLFVNPPDVTVYKAGYVAWNNNAIFNVGERTDFRWKNWHVFRLERFRSEYSYSEHWNFINDVIHSVLALEKKDLIRSATEWEVDKAFEERRNKAKGDERL